MFKNFFKKLSDKVSAPTKELVRVTEPYKTDFTNPDLIMKTQGRKVYSEMYAKDPDIASAINTRVLALLKLEWQILPASEEEQDKKIAGWVKFALNNMSGNFREKLESMARGKLIHGFKLHEKLWMDRPYEDGEYAGLVGLANLKAKPSNLFEFDVDDFMNIKGIKAKDASGVESGPYDYSRFVHCLHNSEDENPYGTSALAQLFFYYTFKKESVTWWAMFLEDFGNPIVALTIPYTDLKGKTEEEKKAILDAYEPVLESIQQRTRIVLTDQQKLEIIETTRQGNAGYEKMYDKCNEAIYRLILGQTLSTNEGKYGTRGQAAIHEKVKDDIIEADIIALEADLNDSPHSIIKELVDYNFVQVTAYPRFTLVKKADKDLKQEMARLNAAKLAGIPVATKEVYERLDLPMPEKGDDVIEWPALPEFFPRDNQPDFKQFAEGKPKKNTHLLLKKRDAYVEKLLQRDVITPVAVEIVQLRDQIVKRIEKSKAIEKGDYGILNNLDFIKLDGFSKLLRSALINAAYKGNLHGFEWVKSKGYSPAKKFSEGSELLPDDEVLLALKKMTPTRASVFKKLAKEFKSQAVAVAGIEKNKIVANVQLALLDVLKNGGTLADFKKALSEKLVRYTGTVYGKEELIGKEVTPWHAETIFRNNIMRAYNQGQEAIWDDPDLDGFILAFKIVGIDDLRTRDSHGELHGLTLAKGDPLLQTLKPPFDHRCRCGKIPLTKHDNFEISQTIPAAAYSVGFGKG